jgi:hypothetical protein
VTPLALPLARSDPQSWSTADRPNPSWLFRDRQDAAAEEKLLCSNRCESLGRAVIETDRRSERQLDNACSRPTCACSELCGPHAVDGVQPSVATLRDAGHHCGVRFAFRSPIGRSRSANAPSSVGWRPRRRRRPLQSAASGRAINRGFAELKAAQPERAFPRLLRSGSPCRNLENLPGEQRST